MSQETDRLMKNLRTHLPGVLDPVLLLELFNVLDDFFNRSNAWSENIEFGVLASDPPGTIYYIECESTAKMIRLLGVYNPDNTGYGYGYWYGGNFSYPAMMDIPGELVLLRPAGSEQTTLTAVVALSVSDPMARNGYPECPAWVYEQYGLDIMDGVLGRMMSQPAKPYTNDKLALYHTKRFERAVNNARTATIRRGTNNGQAWRFPRSFVTRRQ